MNDTGSKLYDLMSQVLDSAKLTAFAMMKANYVERDAFELPDGKIRGLAVEARDIAVALRDSLWRRFDSLRYHYNLLVNVEERRRQRMQGIDNSVDGFDATWSATLHAHYLFDDLIFNAASLFDYVGNSIWFGFHGQNHIKKKWKKAYEAARHHQTEEGLPGGPKIFGSATGQLILEAHRTLVNDLYGYRSDVIHNRMDAPDVFSQEFWEVSIRPSFALQLPKAYVRHLKSLMGGGQGDLPVDMIGGAEHLVRRTGVVTLGLLEALRNDLGWTEGEPLTILG